MLSGTLESLRPEFRLHYVCTVCSPVSFTLDVSRTCCGLLTCCFSCQADVVEAIGRYTSLSTLLMTRTKSVEGGERQGTDGRLHGRSLRDS